MKSRNYQQIDVFGDTPYFGNPLAVVLDGSDLSDEAMQHFAQWTNLSETTFLLPPSGTADGQAAAADYRVRIFTPGGELPFAGHPTLGTCHAWLRAGGKPQSADFIVQESQIGLVKIRRDGAWLAFAAPPLKRSAPSPTQLAQVAAALGLNATQIVAAQLLDNGPVWLGLLLDSQNTVLQLQPKHADLKHIGLKVGVAASIPPAHGSALISRSNRESRAFNGSVQTNPAAVDAQPVLEVRAFAAPVGIDEDPVTGSLNASLAQWLIADGHVSAPYLAAQGTCLGRAGRAAISQDASGQVWVGGQAVTCIEGTVDL